MFLEVTLIENVENMLMLSISFIKMLQHLTKNNYDLKYTNIDKSFKNVQLIG